MDETRPDRPESGEQLPFEIQSQPTDSTCGPTCLSATYAYFGDTVPFERILEEIPMLEEGGTLGVLLASHALSRGYRATIVTWNLQVFDPTWFAPGADLLANLRARAEVREGKLRFAARAYADFLQRGGKIELRDLKVDLLRRFLRRRVPILTGLSATFLYRDAREDADERPDPVGGDPVGHFVVLTGYSPATREVRVSDPLHPNPLSETHSYWVKAERAIGAIYLGVLTYDANLVIIEPADDRQGTKAP